MLLKSKEIDSLSNANKKPEIKIKLVVLGDIVGKTCLIGRYVAGDFESAEPTIGACYSQKSLILDNNQKILIGIWDTSGQKRFRSLIPMYLRGAQIALVMYNITEMNSFITAKEIIIDVRNTHENAIIFLVGNKLDLENYREVPYETARIYSIEQGIGFMEISVKTGLNVSEMFTEAINEALNHLGLIVPPIHSQEEIQINEPSQKKHQKCS